LPSGAEIAGRMIPQKAAYAVLFNYSGKRGFHLPQARLRQVKMRPNFDCLI
jgi:hypothetical protein